MSALAPFTIAMTGGFVGACIVAGQLYRALGRAVAQRDAAQDMADADNLGWRRADQHARRLASELDECQRIVTANADLLGHVMRERDHERAQRERLERERAGGAL